MQSHFNCIFFLLVGLGDCLYGTRKKLNECTVQGMLGQKIVNVLLDTGCNGVIVKQSLVPNNSFTGNSDMCMII